MRHRLHLILLAAAAVIVGVLAAAGPAAAQLPGIPGLPGTGGIGDVLGGVTDSLGLPSIDDIVSKVVGSLFGSLADALMPDFLKQDSVGVMAWLVAIPNPGAGSGATNIGQLVALMQASGGALLALTSLIASTRSMLPGDQDNAPIAVVQRSVITAAVIVAYPWLVAQVIGLANVVSTGLLQSQIVSAGMRHTVGTVFGAAAFGGTAGGAYLGMLTLGAILMATGLFAVHVMLLYVVPALVVAGPLLLPFHVLRSTEHLPRTWAVTFGGLAIIPIGWCVLFAVAGALSSDLHSGALARAPGGETILGAKTLAAFVVLILYAVALWWPWAVLSHARSIVSAFGVSHGGGPVQRGMSLAGTALRLKFLAALAAGGTAGFVAGRAGSAMRAPRLAADSPSPRSGPAHRRPTGHARFEADRGTQWSSHDRADRTAPAGERRSPTGTPTPRSSDPDVADRRNRAVATAGGDVRSTHTDQASPVVSDEPSSAHRPTGAETVAGGRPQRPSTPNRAGGAARLASDASERSGHRSPAAPETAPAPPPSTGRSVPPTPAREARNTPPIADSTPRQPAPASPEGITRPGPVRPAPPSPPRPQRPEPPRSGAPRSSDTAERRRRDVIDRGQRRGHGPPRADEHPPTSDQRPGRP